MRIRILLAATVAAVLATSALAQSSPPADSGATGTGSTGQGPIPTPRQGLQVEESAVVPYADQSGPSASPTMAIDCQKRPEECRTPATREEAEGPHSPARKLDR